MKTANPGGSHSTKYTYGKLKWIESMEPAALHLILILVFSYREQGNSNCTQGAIHFDSLISVQASNAKWLRLGNVHID